MASKIGILTFHCAHNYGAVLQTYATQRLLTDAGYQVEVIDYRPEYLVKPYRCFDLSRLKGKDFVSTLRHIGSETLLIPVRIARFSAFKTFISRHLLLSDRIENDTCGKRYDAVIVGSDQVWNRKITGGSFDGMYFAEFPLSEKYIAAAVSMETSDLSKDDASYIRAHAEHFSAVSVRESQLADLLEEKCGIHAEHIQDPVVQVDPSVWRKLARPSGRTRPYVLVYRLRNHESIDPFVNKIASRLGAEVVEVSAFPDGRKLFKSRQCESVEGFLGLLAGASYVVTTSFHAMVFSVIFSRPFTCFRFGSGQDTRQESFLKAVGLEERMLSLGEGLPEELSCDFSQVKERLEQLRKYSSDFILNSLSGGYE